jgi:hypothetical protein
VATSRGSAMRPSGVRARIAASGEDGLDERGARVPRRDGVNADAVARPLECERTRGLGEAGFRGGVGDAGGERDLAGDRADVDHARAARVAEVRVQIAREEDRGGEVERDHGFDGFVVVAEEWAADVAAGVVHEDVQRAGDAGGDAGAAVGLRDVRDDAVDAECVHRFDDAVGGARDDRDLRAEG